MKNMVYAALPLLLTLAVALVPIRVQALERQLACAAGQISHTTRLVRVGKDNPRTLAVEAGQQVTVASDSGGNTLKGTPMRLSVGNSDGTSVAFTFGGGMSDAVDVTPIFASGNDHAIALDTDSTGVYWLSVLSPCPVAQALEGTPESALVIAVEASQAAALTSAARERFTAMTEGEPAASAVVDKPTPNAAPLASLDETQSTVETDTVLDRLILALTLAILSGQSLLMRSTQVGGAIALVLLFVAAVILAIRHRAAVRDYLLTIRSKKAA